MKSNDNVVSIQIPTDEQAAIMKQVEELQKKLKPYLIALSPEARRRGLKMSDKTLPFVEKAAEYAKSQTEFTPPFMQVAELDIDLKAYGELTKIYRKVDQLHRDLSDTIRQSGSEAYGEALAYYQAVKQATKMGRPNAQAVYDDLRKRFEQK